MGDRDSVGREGDASRQEEDVIRLSDVGSTFQEALSRTYGEDSNPNVDLRADSAESVVSARISKLGAEGKPHQRYILKGEVGRGGMGVVLKVFDKDLRRNLAMKVILGKSGSGSGDTSTVDPGILSRFLEEAQVTGQLEHPGVIPVHELGVDAEGRVYFTMQLVRGRTLKDVFDLVRDGDPEWSLTRALGILQKVCEAMAYAHDKGVIHRDLKPANIMVGKYGEVYVMDWGLARVEGREDTRDIRIEPSTLSSLSKVRTDREEERDSDVDSPLVTMDGAVVGTPAYMPLEQALGQVEKVDRRSDVYSVGAMLYQLLSGCVPYVPPGARVSSRTILMGVISGPPRLVREVARSIPPLELEAICEKAMARDADARYANMGELGDDLRAFLENRVVSAYRTGALVEFKKWVQRNKALAATAAAATVLAISGVGSVAYVQAEGKAAALEQQEIAEANEQLAQKNERLAIANEAEAERQADIAMANEALATKRAEDVLRLSLAQDYEDLLAEASTLWPPHPDKIEALRSWVTSADTLTASLPELVAKRDELRAGALDRTAAETQADREAHSEYAAFANLRDEIETTRSALAMRRGQAQVELPGVKWRNYPQDADLLNTVAWEMVDPERPTFGREAVGLALATRAAELATAEERPTILKSIAWGRFALGDDEGALEAAFTAFDQASDAQRGDFGDALALLEEAVARASSSEGVTATNATLAELEARAVALEATVSERQTWTFPEEQEAKSRTRWWHKQLMGLIEELESLTTAGLGLLTEEGLSAKESWSIPKRLAFAQGLEAGLATGGEFALRWEAALPLISDTYPGLVLTAQVGLVPIGADPTSDLWEFWHVQSGTEPQRDEAGEFVIEEDSGLVLVLLPGGTFWMGAQSSDPAGRNYDKDADSNEGPVHEVGLSAFFLSKYEMTQGQWQRLAGSNPSNYGPSWVFLGHQHDLTHPVEQVSWLDCVALLPRAGLDLPSEAQWEYGARGGTDTVWWTGSERDSLKDLNAVNLADQAGARGGATWSEIEDWPELDDGFVAHAPVNEYAANGFGLYNVHGNVREWCLDGHEEGFYGRGAVLDPVSSSAASAIRVNRGGSFNYTAADARAANRNRGTPSFADFYLGLRPTRVITE